MNLKWLSNLCICWCTGEIAFKSGDSKVLFWVLPRNPGYKCDALYSFILLEGTFFWVFKRKDDLIYRRERLRGISKIFTPGASFQICQKCGKERGKLLPWQCFGGNGPANKCHLKAAWSKNAQKHNFISFYKFFPQSL